MDLTMASTQSSMQTIGKCRPGLPGSATTGRFSRSTRRGIALRSRAAQHDHRTQTGRLNLTFLVRLPHQVLAQHLLADVVVPALRLSLERGVLGQRTRVLPKPVDCYRAHVDEALGALLDR